MREIIVTTGDLKQDYEVIGPVYFQVAKQSFFRSTLPSLKKQYVNEIRDMKKKGSMSQDRNDWGFIYGEWSAGQSDFEFELYIATQELKKRCELVGGDAVICMRQDIDFHGYGLLFSYFFLQMYGTAVRLK